MQKKTLALTTLTLLAVIAIGAWWYASNQNPSGQATVAVDRSALIRPHSPSLGRADAPVVIVEFLDPACETCRTFYPMVKQLMAQHPDRIRLVVRYASQQDWASNHTAKVDLAWKYLEPIGLNMEQLAIDLTAPEVKQAVAQDLADANTLGVSQTPEYFVNGRPLPSFGFEQLRQLVAEEVA